MRLLKFPGPKKKVAPWAATFCLVILVALIIAPTVLAMIDTP